MPTRTSPGSFEVATLLAVSLKPETDAHAAAVAHHLSKSFGVPANVSAVHATLTRLTDKSLVASKVGKPIPGKRGRARRLFRVTAKGKKTLADARKVAERMWGK